MPDFEKTEGLIIDLDGVLWRGSTPLPGVQPFFALLRRRKLPFVLATNNATALPEAIQARLAALEVVVTLEEILTAALAAAEWLKSALPPEARLLPIGEAGLIQALENAGFSLAGDARLPVDAVVVGMDRQFNAAKLAEATYAIRSGAQFIGTNPDRTFPTERGLAPGAGAILAALSAATDVSPTIIGKPEAHLYLLAQQRLQTSSAHTTAIGDRLETDILGAQRAGIKSALVLSGVTDRQLLAASSIQPDWVFTDLVSLTQALQGAADE